MLNYGKVSVIIPVYNIAEYVKKCLESIINQTYKNIEIIVVDDGSSDNSFDICEEFSNDKRVKVFHKTNGGLSDARNYGLEKASGDYIIFVDGDDYVEKDYIKILLSELIEKDVDIAICDFYYTYGNNDRKGTSYKNDFIIDSNIDAIKELYSFTGYGVGVWNKLFKKELLWSNMFPFGKISEDYFVMYKLFFKSKRVSYVNKQLYHYVQRSRSITKYGPLKYDVIEAADQFYDFCKKNLPELVELALCNLVFSAIGLYNTGKVRNNMSKEDEAYFINIVKEYYHLFSKKNMIKNRKIQLYLFKYFRKLYDVIYILLKKIRIRIKGR